VPSSPLAILPPAATVRLKENVMERDQNIELVELGTASLDTHGAIVGRDEEFVGFYPLAISDE
jgi:hypothetical protein